MDAPETAAVMRALAAEGAVVRFVGGCVRDTIAGRPVKDIDIATPDPPDRVIALLERAGLGAVPTGVAHGTVTAISNHKPFEVTTLRVDVEAFGRHARVAFTDDWAADAARRDFTMNALFLDPDGTLYDPTGGMADLEEGRVRFVGGPAERIREDYLRLLRFFRFHAHYGKGAPDAAALDACRELALGVKGLSGERIAAEMLKLLAAPDPASALRLMREAGVLGHIFFGPADIDRLAALLKLEGQAGAYDPLCRLTALIDSEPAALNLAQRWRLSAADRERLAALAAPPALYATPPRNRDLAVRTAEGRALYRLGAVLYRDLLLLDWAGRAVREESGLAERFTASLAAAKNWQAPRFPLRGQDALDLGVAPGPRVGELIAALEEWWIENGFKPDRKACLERLRRSIGG